MTNDIGAFKEMNIIKEHKEKYKFLKTATWIFILVGIALCVGCVLLGFYLEEKQGTGNNMYKYIGIGAGIIILLLNLVISELMTMLVNNANNNEKLVIYTSRTNQLLNSYLKGEALIAPVKQQTNETELSSGLEIL